MNPTDALYEQIKYFAKTWFVMEFCDKFTETTKC